MDLDMNGGQVVCLTQVFGIPPQTVRQKNIGFYQVSRAIVTEPVLKIEYSQKEP